MELSIIFRIFSGRNVDPQNLHKELFCKYNAPPLEEASEVIERTVNRTMKFKADGEERIRDTTTVFLSTNPARMNFPVTGSAIGQQRRRDLEAAHLPSEIFK